MILNSVDFPPPLGPSRAVSSPVAISRSMSSQRHEVAESLGYASDLDTHGAPLLGRRLVMMIKAITAISARMKAAVYAVIEFTRPNC